MYPAGKNCYSFGFVIILFIVKYSFVNVCKHYTSHFQFMCKAFPVNSCLLFCVLSSVKNVFGASAPFKYQDLKYHAVTSVCIPNDMIQKPKCPASFFGTDLQTYL